MPHNEFEPGDTAPGTGPYIALNVFGAPVDLTVDLQQGQTFPALPRGFTWKPLSAYSTDELRDRAQYYRQMAGTASTTQVRDELLKLAQRFDTLAAGRERAD